MSAWWRLRVSDETSDSPSAANLDQPSSDPSSPAPGVAPEGVAGSCVTPDAQLADAADVTAATAAASAASRSAAASGGPVKRPAFSGGPPKAFSGWWLFIACVLVAASIWVCIAVGRARDFSYAHRAAAAGGALLVLLTMAVLAEIILLWYQSRLPAAPGPPLSPNVAFRLQGLKAAIIGQDGRASTSKTGVASWTGAVVTGLVNMLLLARSFPGGNLFTGAVTSNWRAEYLVLLGLPVAAATAAKAAVATSNGGNGPYTSADPLAQTGTYVRDPVPANIKGVIAGIAELITGDDGRVAWADLQYVIFTLITLVYFVTQLLAQPQNGLPAVPGTLLTLMGVSAGAYTANKMVSTRAPAWPGVNA